MSKTQKNSIFNRQLQMWKECGEIAVTDDCDSEEENLMMPPPVVPKVGLQNLKRIELELI